MSRRAQEARQVVVWPDEERRPDRASWLSPEARRKNAIRKRVAVTVLMRRGLTVVEAEDQYEAGLWRR